MNLMEFDALELTNEQIHDLFARQMEFPEWYGRNLDALYDCLCEMTEEWTVIVKNSDELDEGILTVLTDASQENTYINVMLM